MVRMSKGYDRLIAEMENFYVHHSSGSSKNNRSKIRQLAKKL